jgi:hypothetical protein
MNVKKLIEPLIETIILQRKALLEIERFLSLAEEILLTLEPLVKCITLDGYTITFHPSGSAHKLRQALERELNWTFTRAYPDNGLYQWETVPYGFNLILRIQANEFIDLTGTTPQ